MRINKFLVTSIIFLMSGSAHAGDLFWSGALSGAGKGMAEWASQMQALEAQRALMEQQYRMEREREERAYQQQQERERAERAEYERARAEHLQQLEANRRSTEYQKPMTESVQTARAKLSQLHPDWEAIIGPKDSQTPFRKWLAAQPAAYKSRIQNSWDPAEVAQAIDWFKKQTMFRQREVGSSQDRYCVASDATGEMLFTMPNGKMGEITIFYGESAQCSDPKVPILVNMKEVKF